MHRAVSIQSPYYHAGARHYLYVIRGPGGVYVGCSIQPIERWFRHVAIARAQHPAYVTDLHRAMWHDGIESYALEVVACASNLRDGRRVEAALIRQFQDDGERILNLKLTDFCELPL